jgi:hypothetical protein
MVESVFFGILAFAALLLYAWTEDLWDWHKSEKGFIDLEVAPEVVQKQEITTDINYIKRN